LRMLPMSTERDHAVQRVPQVVSRIMAALHGAERSGFAEVGLTIPAARALLFIQRQGPMRVSLLAELLGMEDSALSHLLQKLERKRLIERERFSEDRRAVYVSLTSAGRTMASSCDEIAGRAAARLLQDLPEADVTRLRVLLEKVVSNIKVPREHGTQLAHAHHL
jgi:DNA-binding MarR family transcriptional regulator